MKTNMKKKGFTLVELLVVIAIIAILATVSVVGYTAFLDKANQSNAMTEAAQVEEAIKANLMADDDYVIGTVKPKDTDTLVAGTSKQTTYYVDADTKKVYTKESTWTLVGDDPATTDVVETDYAEWGEFVDVEIPDVAEDAPDKRLVYTGSLTAAFDANADFAALDGEFAVDANGVITYTYKDDAKATIELN